MFLSPFIATETTPQWQLFQLTNPTEPIHYHDAYELIIVHQGSLELTIEQDIYTMTSRDLAFIFSNQLHRFTTTDETEITMVLFSPTMIAQFHQDYGEYLPENQIFSIEKPEFLNRLTTIYSQKSYLYGLCDAVIKSTDFLPIKASAKRNVMKQLLDYISQTYQHDSSLKGASENLEYDYAYLSKVFTHMADMSFTEYLNRYRILKAAEYLQQDELTIAEISEKIGYNNLRNFNRNFRKITGTSANEYRQQINQ